MAGDISMSGSGIRGPRLPFIDNLRWSAISMVVVMHAAVTYSPFGSWYVREHPPLSLAAKIGFATYQSFQHAVSMGLLFGIAGYFAAQALARKGAAGFLRERTFRLGVPLLVYILLIGPATEYFVAGSWGGEQSFGAAWLRHLADGDLASGSGPLWFCLVLLVFCVALVAMRPVAPVGWMPVERAPVARPVPGAAAVLGYAAAMATVTFALGVVAPRDRVLLNVDVHDFPQYPLMFAAGMLAWRNDWPLRVTSAAGRRWLMGGLVGGGVLWAVLVVLGGALAGNLRAYEGGWTWQAAGMDIWRSVTCLSLSLGLIVLFRDRFNGLGRVARFLTRTAFGVYVFHPPVLILVTRALHAWPGPVGVKFMTASLAAVIVTFLFVGLLVRRIPLVRAVV